MKEYERAMLKKSEDRQQKNLIRGKYSEQLPDQFKKWDTELSSLTETPFEPPIRKHAQLLAMTHSDIQQSNLVLHLQRTYGNKYVQRLIESSSVHAKPTGNTPNDIYESETDRVAKMVTRSTQTSVSDQPQAEEELQAKPTLQRQPEEEEEVAQAKLDTRGVVQDGSRIDTKVEPAIQVVRDGVQPKNNAVQRMVVAATDDMAKVKDPLVWNNLEFAKSEAGGYVGDMMDWDQFKSEEPVRIVGHGDPDTGQLTAESGPSAKMFDADTIRNRIASAKGLDRSKMNWASKLLWGKKLNKIEFQSCYSAKKIPPAPASGAALLLPPPAPTALIDRMGKELSNIGQKGVEVAGRPGIAFGFKGMGAATSELSEVEFDRTMDEMWNRSPKTKGGADIFKAKGVYNDPWVIAGVPTEAAWNLLSIEDKMNKVAKQMKKYWKDFKAEMGPGGFLDTATEIRKITS